MIDIFCLCDRTAAACRVDRMPAQQPALDAAPSDATSADGYTAPRTRIYQNADSFGRTHRRSAGRPSGRPAASAWRV